MIRFIRWALGLCPRHSDSFIETRNMPSGWEQYIDRGTSEVRIDNLKAPVDVPKDGSYRCPLRSLRTYSTHRNRGPSMSKHVEVIIAPDGTAKHLVDAVSERFGEVVGPKISTQRNSHIETWVDLSHAAREWLVVYGEITRTRDEQTRCYKGKIERTNMWWADMLPVGGPVIGPFHGHDEAIDCERKWLQVHDLPEKADGQ